MEEGKRTLLADALNSLYTTGIILTKLDIVRASLTLMNLQMEDVEPLDCITVPQILAKILFIVNKHDETL